MKGKSSKQFLFEVQLHWIAENRGTLFAKDATGILHVETPPAFGGKGKPWTPEHLFLGAISSCFMTTFLAFARKNELTIEHFSCPASGRIELVDGKYIFTHIDLYAEIHIMNESQQEKAKETLEQARKYCLVANSINPEIAYHTQVFIDKKEQSSNSENFTYEQL